ncbi:MAG: HdeD family acid-resistance protein [Actinobacteria bacterium]|nr:HdeD family acid-resistance protein [Actinomycetota bacterium]
MEGLEAVKWTSVLARGLVAIAFGIVLLAWPGATVFAAIVVFGAFAIITGVFGAFSAIGGRRERAHWVWSLIGGLLSIVVGVVALAYPGETAVVLLYLIAAMAIVWGVSDLFLALGIRGQLSGWGVLFLVLAGIISVAFGIYAIVNPGKGAIAILWLIGVYEIAWGLLLTMVSFAVRSAQKHGGGGMTPA